MKEFGQVLKGNQVFQLRSKEKLLVVNAYVTDQIPHCGAADQKIKNHEEPAGSMLHVDVPEADCARGDPTEIERFEQTKAFVLSNEDGPNEQHQGHTTWTRLLGTFLNPQVALI